jgi:outer membrane biogenesis lipoprotein LolB
MNKIFTCFAAIACLSLAACGQSAQEEHEERARAQQAQQEKVMGGGNQPLPRAKRNPEAAKL